MFLRSRNPLLIFLPGYPIWVTSKSFVNYPFERFSEVLMIVSYGILQYIFNIYVFKVSNSFADIFTVILCLGDLEN